MKWIKSKRYLINLSNVESIRRGTIFNRYTIIFDFNGDPEKLSLEYRREEDRESAYDRILYFLKEGSVIPVLEEENDYT